MTATENWIIGQGLSGSSVATLLAGTGERLAAEGVALARAYLALPTVDPATRVYSHIWAPATGTMVESISHDRNEGAFEASPFGSMLRAGVTQRHWRFDKPGTEWFEVFDDVARSGGTDYLARLIRFENESAPELRGIAAAFSASRPGGFQPREVDRIDAVLPLLGLAAYRITLFDLTVAMLDTYVGLSAGRRVLNGEIRRGSGTTITAALLVADLRGFTALADRAGEELISRLDQHLEAMAEPVVEQGGEVLKFLGDGLLAAFPITAERSREAACAAAVRSALAALDRNRSVNLGQAGEPPLALDVALHCGDVFYGNIGAANRLDFTVIGRAVNEASRMEALCGVLDCSVVMSAMVASASPVPTRSLGRHVLRGLSTEQELFTLAT